MSERRFPPPWTVETIPGGLKVCDANGQSLAYVSCELDCSTSGSHEVRNKDKGEFIRAMFEVLRDYDLLTDD